MWLAESRRAGGTGLQCAGRYSLRRMAGGTGPTTWLRGCMQMLERAIRKFIAAGLRPQAQAFETQLARLKATEGK